MQNRHHLSPEAREHFDRLSLLAEKELAKENKRDKTLFLLRLERYFQNLYDALHPLYGERKGFDAFLNKLMTLMTQAYKTRSEDLRLLDIERDLSPDWFQRESMIGYVFYVERFAGSVKGTVEHLGYLKELGVTYIHLMNVIRAREGENDGGFAVLDYKDVDPKLGAADDIEVLAAELREHGISLCIDLVLNHCAKEHEWALKAKEGSEAYQDYFYMFDDRTLPDQYEKTLPEIFPDFAPGNFSHYPEIDKWVWTTFNEYQWDLNWSNPAVFLEIADIMFYWANRGIEVFRLDAVAFMWKRMGTNSQNQAEVFDILQALRSVARIVSPAVTHKAEAIVSPDDLIRYFGVGRHYGKVSNIAYHNSLMVQYWSALASRDTRLMSSTLNDFPATPSSIAWGTYVRCHDDIGWAVTDEDAAAVGLDGFSHRSFLSEYYAGLFKGSHARGEVFQFNPETMDRRISGTNASLAGLEQALENQDEKAIQLSIERILLGHALICGFGGIPLIYMGDELGLLNDYTFVNDPRLKADNRWVHRPYMPWDIAEKRLEAGTPEARIFSGIKKIITARKQTPQFHASYLTEIIESYSQYIFAHIRRHPLGNLLALYNFSEAAQSVPVGLLRIHGLEGRVVNKLEAAEVQLLDGQLFLRPYERLWLTSKEAA